MRRLCQTRRMAPQNFDTVFTHRLLGSYRGRKGDTMDIVFIGLAIGFFIVSGWLISALNRL